MLERGVASAAPLSYWLERVRSPRSIAVDDWHSIMILGITGGVATGKSTILGLLPNMAARYDVSCSAISADAIARDLLDPGTDYSRRVIEHFGCEYALSPSEFAVNRTLLGQRVFRDADSRRWLENLLHPSIIDSLVQAGAPYKASSDGVMAMEVPLLYEAGIERIVDIVLVTRCSQPTQIRRIIERRPGVTEEDAIHQILSQLPQDEKARRANYVIDTDQALDDVERQFGQIIERIIG